MKKSLLLFVYGLLTLAFLLFLWQYGIRNSGEDGLGEPSDGLVGDVEEQYVMVTFQSNIDYWRPVMKGFEDAAAKLNVAVDFRGATQYDPIEQITVLEQVIARKPAGIAVTAIDPEKLNEAIGKAAKAGIPLVLFDSGAEGSGAQSFVGTDNYRAGAVAARELAKRLSGQGTVAVITQPNQLNHRQRTEGFQDTIAKEFPGLRIVEVADGKGTIDASRRAAEDIVARHPELDGFFATQANGGVGIGQAMKKLKLPSRKIVIGFDTDKGTLDMVKDGTIDATLAQGTWNMGYWSLLGLFHLRHGIVQPSSEEKGGVHPLPPFIDTGITIVTQDNVELFYAR